MAARKDRRKGWMVDFVFQHADGHRERVRKPSPVQTRRGAEEYERQLRHEMLNPRPKRKEVPTLAAFADEFLDTYARNNLKVSTQKHYKDMLNCHIVPALGSRRLDAIGVRDIEAIKSVILRAGRKPKTVNNALASLRKLLNYAVEVEVIERPPARIKLLKVPPQPFHFLDFDEYHRLIGHLAAKDGELHLAVLLGGDAGLRAGEICGLRWGDVFFPGPRLTVQRSIWRGHVQSPKGGRSRTVPLTERLCEALKGYRHLGTYVLHRGRDPWTEETLRWSASRMYRLAGMATPPSPWHCLRHTFCSHLVMRGASPKAIQELAGHADLQTTMRYMHLAPSVLREAISLLNEHPHGTYVAPNEIGEKKMGAIG